MRSPTRSAHRPTIRVRPAYAVAATAIAGALTIAGCSSSGSSSSAGGSAAGTGAAGATASGTAASGGTGAAAALAAGTKNVTGGNPVVIGVLYTDDNPIGTAPEIKSAGEAAADYVNSHGGIGGRPVKIVACNGMNNAQNDAQCATQFVNSGVVTVEGLDGFWGGVGVSIIGKAGIANQTLPISGPEFSAPNAYPWEGSGVTASAAAASYFVQQKLTSACAYQDIPSFQEQCVEDFQKPAQALGASPQLVTIPPTANDLSQYAAKLQQTGAKGVLVVAGSPATPDLIQAAAQLGYKPQWILPSQQPDFFKAVGADADGAIFYDDLVDSSDTTNPDAAVFRAAMAKWAPGAVLDAFSIMTFSNIVTLARLGDQVGGDKITRAELPTLLGQIKNLPQFMGPTLNASTHLAGLPHALHTGAYLYQWNGTGYTLAGKGYYVVPGATG
jgi:branched-chain amino acid transport system substrate-binding protein